MLYLVSKRGNRCKLKEIFSDKLCVHQKKKDPLPSLSETLVQRYSENLLSEIISQFLEDSIYWVTRVNCCWGKTYLISLFLTFMLKINARFLTVLLGIQKTFFGKNITVPSPVVHDFITQNADIFVHQDK